MLAIVKIVEPGKYSKGCKKFGILRRMMPNTAIISMESDVGGLAINIQHGDYQILPPAYCGKVGTKVFVYDNGKCVDTGLNLYRH